MSEEEFQPDKVPRFVTTQSELARYIHVHRNTVIAWSKDTESPKQTARGHEIVKWLEYKAKVGKRTNDENPSSYKAKQGVKLDEQIRALKLANDEKDGLLILIKPAVEKITALVSEFNQEVRKIEDGLPQALLGLGLPEQRLKIREMFDALRLKISKGESGITKT